VSKPDDFLEETFTSLKQIYRDQKEKSPSQGSALVSKRSLRKSVEMLDKISQHSDSSRTLAKQIVLQKKQIQFSQDKSRLSHRHSLYGLEHTLSQKSLQIDVPKVKPQNLQNLLKSLQKSSTKNLDSSSTMMTALRKEDSQRLPVGNKRNTVYETQPVMTISHF